MKTTRIIIGVLLAIIALNAFGGGYYALSGAENVPLEWLQASPFSSYFIPGLFLFVALGGICLAGAIAAFMNSKRTRSISLLLRFFLPPGSLYRSALSGTFHGCSLLYLSVLLP